MPVLDTQQGLTPSFLDRLIDPESGGSAGVQGYTVEQMEAAVYRDLEDLLNTRLSQSSLPPDYAQLHNSVFAYGLPDLVGLEAVTRNQREQIGRLLVAVINKFEKRLRNVRAVLTTPQEGKERSLAFRIEARLCLEPAPEVTFDTIVELSTGHYTVQAGES